MKLKIGIVLGIMLFTAAACGLIPFGPPAPTLDTNAIIAAAAQTLEAQQSGSTGGTGNTGGTSATATFTVPAPVIPNDTPTVTPTATATVPAGVCNEATFISDVTYPDGTGVNFGTGFTKTWRLKNTGTCTWTSGYSLIFDHGDQMGGPAAQSLTSGTVPPGATLDVSVNLTAPSTAGTYRGYWRLREPGGVSFGLPSGSSFYVEIKAVNPMTIVTLAIPPLHILPLLSTFTVDLVVQPSYTGSVRSDGTVLYPLNVGDTEANVSSQGFVSFDFTGIPAGSTINDASVTFNDYDTLGNPFSLGYLRLYGQVFGSVNASDFFTGLTTNSLIRWGSTTDLNSQMAGTPQLISYIQSRVGNSLLQFRVQFNDNATNSNDIADMVRFGNGIKVTVKYTTP